MSKWNEITKLGEKIKKNYYVNWVKVAEQLRGDKRLKYAICYEKGLSDIKQSEICNMAS